MPDPSEASSDADRSATRLNRSEVSSAAMPIGRAQGLALVIIGAFALLTLLPHVMIWGVSEALFSVSLMDVFLFGGLFIAGTVVHEGIHGLGYVWSGAAWSEVEFGFNWSGFAPYAHCGAPLRCGPYRWAVALPGIMLGALPLAAGLITGHGGTTLFAYAMLAAAGGDVVLLWMLRGIPRSAWVQDHPRKMGALVLGHSSSEAAPRLAFDPEAGTQVSENGDTRTTRWLLGIVIVSVVVGGVAGFMAASM